MALSMALYMTCGNKAQLDALLLAEARHLDIVVWTDHPARVLRSAEEEIQGRIQLSVPRGS